MGTNVENMVTSLSVGAGATVTPTPQTPFLTKDCRSVAISVKLTVPTAASGYLTIRLGSWNTVDWDNVPFREMTIDLSEGEVSGSDRLIYRTFTGVPIGSARQIKVLELENGDASNGITVDYIKALKLFGDG